jgi:hypothetical protein
MTGTEREHLQSEFEATAAPPRRVTVPVELDADLVEWLETQPLGLQREINSAVRFIMDMSSQPVPPVDAYEFDARFTEPEAGPDLVRDADRIEHDFAP